MQTETIILHHKYFISFLDDYSGFGRVYLLRRKSESIQAFRNFKAWAENQTGFKIETLRLDRGGEYTSSAFRSLLEEYGIEHQKTVARSPQQNGRAERWNRTLVEKAMTMMHFAGLSHGFWAVAIETAVHIYNRQPIRRIGWRCPITLWFNNTKPDVSYFRVFGCKCFIHVQKEDRHGKLDKKAINAVFVGYESGSKGYKLWNPATHNFVVFRDVTFDEECFPVRKDLSHPSDKSDSPPSTSDPEKQTEGFPENPYNPETTDDPDEEPVGDPEPQPEEPAQEPPQEPPQPAPQPPPRPRHR